MKHQIFKNHATKHQIRNKILALALLSVALIGSRANAQPCTPITDDNNERVTFIGLSLAAIKHCKNIPYNKEQVQKALHPYYCSKQNIKKMNQMMRVMMIVGKKRFTGKDKVKLCNAWAKLKFPE